MFKQVYRENMKENLLFQDISEHVNMNKYAGWATKASVSMEAFLKIFFSNFFDPWD